MQRGPVSRPPCPKRLRAGGARHHRPAAPGSRARGPGAGAGRAHQGAALLARYLPAGRNARPAACTVAARRDRPAERGVCAARPGASGHHRRLGAFWRPDPQSPPHAVAGARHQRAPHAPRAAARLVPARGQRSRRSRRILPARRRGPARQRGAADRRRHRAHAGGGEGTAPVQPVRNAQRHQPRRGAQQQPGHLAGQPLRSAAHPRQVSDDVHRAHGNGWFPAAPSPLTWHPGRKSAAADPGAAIASKPVVPADGRPGKGRDPPAFHPGNLRRRHRPLADISARARHSGARRDATGLRRTVAGGFWPVCTRAHRFRCRRNTPAHRNGGRAIFRLRPPGQRKPPATGRTKGATLGVPVQRSVRRLAAAHADFLAGHAQAACLQPGPAAVAGLHAPRDLHPVDMGRARVCRPRAVPAGAGAVATRLAAKPERRELAFA